MGISKLVKKLGFIPKLKFTEKTALDLEQLQKTAFKTHLPGPLPTLKLSLIFRTSTIYCLSAWQKKTRFLIDSNSNAINLNPLPQMGYLGGFERKSPNSFFSNEEKNEEEREKGGKKAMNLVSSGTFLLWIEMKSEKWKERSQRDLTF